MKAKKEKKILARNTLNAWRRGDLGVTPLPLLLLVKENTLARLFSFVCVHSTQHTTNPPFFPLPNSLKSFEKQETKKKAKRVRKMYPCNAPLLLEQ